MSLMRKTEVWLLVAALAAPGVAHAASKSITMKLEAPAEVAGQELAPGSYKIAWKGEADAEFTVSRSGKVVAQGKGRFEERPKAALDDAIVFRKDSSGRTVVSEIQFGGKKSVLVLGAS